MELNILKKRILLLTILLVIILIFSFTISSIAACNKKTQEQLNIYVWEGYIPEEVSALFEQETAIKLNTTFIAENSRLWSLMKGGSEADIIMPTNSWVQRYYEADFAQPLDLKKITNYEKNSKYLREQPWTKWDGKQIGYGETYVIPYISGTTGIVINISRYTKNIDGIGWEVFFDTDLKGKVASDYCNESLWMILDLYGIPRENLITDTQGTLEQIRDKVIELKNNVLKFTSSGSEVSDLMKNEEVWVAQIWDGGGRSLSKFDSKFKYVLPKSGGMAWADSFMIPKRATNPSGAYLFIDFMLRTDIAAMVTEQGDFTTTVEGALDRIQGVDKNLYELTDEEMTNLKWTINYSEEIISIYTAFWEELTAVK